MKHNVNKKRKVMMMMMIQTVDGASELEATSPERELLLFCSKEKKRMNKQ